MRRQSLKRRLIAELERHVDELEHGTDGDADRDLRTAALAVAHHQLRELRARGSGPLPYWAKRLADALGLTPDPTRPQSSVPT